MGKRIVQLKLFFLVLLLCGGSVLSQTGQPFSINESPLPAPTGFVNDYAGVLDAGTKQRLEERLRNLKQTTNPPVEIGVAIVRTTGDRPIFDYSLAVARGWGIGSKNDDNPSALLFIAIDDRKYFTQVSRDLEDELPDGLVGSLQRQYLVPEFKKGNYGKGVEDTVNAYIRAVERKLSGQPAATVENEQRETRRAERGGGCNFMICLIILFILMIIIFSRGSSGRGGGGFGGGGALPWIIGSIVASELSRGGGSSSSGWGGGSGGWGGFGGGGDFGGGGAGGDW